MRRWSRAGHSAIQPRHNECGVDRFRKESYRRERAFPPAFARPGEKREKEAWSRRSQLRNPIGSESVCRSAPPSCGIIRTTEAPAADRAPQIRDIQIGM